MKNSLSRRQFMNSSLTAATGLAVSGILPAPALATGFPPENNLLVVGPVEGYSPMIGTLVSMLRYNRETIINTIKNLTVAQLDFLFDGHANTIGALVMHLGATDKFYQINTFEGRQEMNAAEKKEWGAAMELNEAGRKEIKGHDAQYYIDKITAVREETLAKLKTKDDAWLLALDPVWSKQQPVNTYWKWFHVCEHESNHRGQITWLKSRLPGAKPAKD
ncbi:DinB family protein [Spirosoma sp. KUDC1026]|uniref:DinB family protein n=1 Tax=Spirosoma sp. KUDC1026 TaxID=2745947 RepID=UPI001C3F98B2|nr:DUF664 domain-containing protein [Spirosoma sp. KUDC1026]